MSTPTLTRPTANPFSLLAPTTLHSLLSSSTPTSSPLHTFFSQWLHIDITKLALLLTLCGVLSGAITDIQDTARRFYWWVARFFTASISIAGHDRLNREVINWLGAHVLKPKARVLSLAGSSSGGRILTARSSESQETQNDAFLYSRHLDRSSTFLTSPTTTLERRSPVQYLPTFNTVWFMYERNVFVIRRIPESDSKRSDGHFSFGSEYTDTAVGKDPLVVMCLGRSVAPVKRFLSACRDFADQQSDRYVTVRTTKGGWVTEAWDVSILRPRRSLESVHLDRKVKEELVRDLESYLHPATRRFYLSRGIPYRRGYLLYGPPGTGKTSLSLALAAHFRMDLHLIHLPSLCDDADLDKLFVTLPPRCLVLLEDIDCVSLRRHHKTLKKSPEHPESSSSDSDPEDQGKVYGQVSLSGLLNVLDGVTSQEGRIVLMTTNMLDNLDDALVRPGRVDKRIYLGLLSKESAGEMFIRMYDEIVEAKGREEIFEDSASTAASSNPFMEGASFASPVSMLNSPWDRETLHRLAFQFAHIIPDQKFSPAAVQGFLLDHKESPFKALRYVDEWVVGELQKVEEAERLLQRQTEKRLHKRKNEKLRRKVRNMQEEHDLQESMKTSIKRKEQSRRQEQKRSQQDKQATVESAEEGDEEEKEGAENDRIPVIPSPMERKGRNSKRRRRRRDSGSSVDTNSTRVSQRTISEVSEISSSSSILRLKETTSPMTSPEPDSTILVKKTRPSHRRSNTRSYTSQPSETPCHLTDSSEQKDEQKIRDNNGDLPERQDKVSVKEAAAVVLSTSAVTHLTLEPPRPSEELAKLSVVETTETTKPQDAVLNPPYPVLSFSAMSVKETKPLNQEVSHVITNHPPSEDISENKNVPEHRNSEGLEVIAEEEDVAVQPSEEKTEKLPNEIAQNGRPVAEAKGGDNEVKAEINREENTKEGDKRLGKIEEEKKKAMDKASEVLLKRHQPTWELPPPTPSSIPSIPASEAPQNPQNFPSPTYQIPSYSSHLPRPSLNNVYATSPLQFPQPPSPASITPSISSLPGPPNNHQSPYFEPMIPHATQNPPSRPTSLKQTGTNESLPRTLSRDGSVYAPSISPSFTSTPRPASRPGTASTINTITNIGSRTPPMTSPNGGASILNKLPLLRRRTSSSSAADSGSGGGTPSPRSRFQSAVGSVMRGRRSSSASVAAPVVDLKEASRSDVGK